MKPLLVCVLIAALHAPVAAAFLPAQTDDSPGVDLIVDVRVEGNRRLSDAAFFRLTTLRSRQPYFADTIREQYQVLWKTNLFDDLWVEALDATGGKVVVFHVLERPVVVQVIYQKSSVVSRPSSQDFHWIAGAASGAGLPR